MEDSRSKKTVRQFNCRDALWSVFEEMARELECSVDYLINEAMRQYAKSRRYAVPAADAQGAPAGAAPSAPPAAPAAPAPAATVRPGPAPVPPRPRVSAPPPAPPTPAGPPTSRQSPVPAAPPPVAGVQPSAPPRPVGISAPPPRPSMPAAPPAPPAAPVDIPVSLGPETDAFAQASRATSQMPAVGAPAAAPPQMVGGVAYEVASAPSTGQGRAPLYLIFNGQRIPVRKEQFVIGRGLKSSDLAIKDSNISRRHAAVLFHNGAYYIKDLGSTNGIEYNGMRIDSKRIEEGDLFKICEYEFRFTYQ